MAMQQMTVEKINELVMQLVAPVNNVLVITAPEVVKASLPEEALANFFSWVSTAEMEPYKVETVDRPLLSEEVKSGNVKKSKKGMYGSTVWTLDNGIRVVVLPTN